MSTHPYQNPILPKNHPCNYFWPYLCFLLADLSLSGLYRVTNSLGHSVDYIWKGVGFKFSPFIHLLLIGLFIHTLSFFLSGNLMKPFWGDIYIAPDHSTIALYTCTHFLAHIPTDWSFSVLQWFNKRLIWDNFVLWEQYKRGCFYNLAVLIFKKDELFNIPIIPLSTPSNWTGKCGGRYCNALWLMFACGTALTRFKNPVLDVAAVEVFYGSSYNRMFDICRSA